MIKRDTPSPCPKPAGNLLSDSTESIKSRSPEFIYITNEEIMENKTLQQTVSGFSVKKK